MATEVGTGRVGERRRLRFDTLAELRVELDRIEAAERAGRLRRSGNWTAGQTLGHIAAWMSYPYDGFPMGRAPWFVRAFVSMRRRHYLHVGMPSGVRIPRVKGGTYGIEDMSLDEGAARLRRAIARLESGAQPPHPSPVFGPMGLEDWIRLNLRHAELHLSFLDPE